MIQMYNNRLFGNYLTMTFSDIYPNVDVFMADAKSEHLKMLLPYGFSDNNIKTLFYLLTAKYANNSIASDSLDRFKFHLFSLIFQYGGTWQKKLEIQNKIRTLEESEARKSGRTIDNHAYNPGTPASADTVDNLEHIDQQNQRLYEKSLLETYAEVSALLEEDITGDFIEKFKVLFLWVVSPQRPLWYVNDPSAVELPKDEITNENL